MSESSALEQKETEQQCADDENLEEILAPVTPSVSAALAGGPSSESERGEKGDEEARDDDGAIYFRDEEGGEARKVHVAPAVEVPSEETVSYTHLTLPTKRIV